MAPKGKASKTPKAARERGPKRTKAMIADNQWYVERILGEGIKTGVLKYLVKWQGFAEREASWRMREDIADDIFEAYERAKRDAQAHQERQAGAEETEEEEQEDDRAKAKTPMITGKKKSLRTDPARAEAEHPVSTDLEGAGTSPTGLESTDISLSDHTSDDVDALETSVGAPITYSQSSKSDEAAFEYDDYFEVSACGSNRDLQGFAS